MQVALPLEETIKRRIIGLTAVLLTGTAVTPANMQAIQEMSKVDTLLINKAPVCEDSENIAPEQAVNTKVMEEKAGAENFTCLNVSNIRLIEEKKEELELREKIVESVLTWQGVPYRWGGQTRAGVDCSALVQRVFRENGIKLPRTSYQQFKQGVGIPKAKLKPGDLVFFNTNGAGASHVGIYLGERKFISATKNCVEIQSLDSTYWVETYRGSRRVIR